MRKIKYISVFAFLIIFLTAISGTVFAASGVSDADLNDQLSYYDLSGVDSVIKKNTGSPGFKDLVGQAVNGTLDLSFSGIVQSIFDIFFGELKTHLGLIRNLVIIALLSAIIKNLSDSLESKAVSELGFYVGYISLVIIAFQAFQLAVSVVQNLINDLADIMQASLPLMMSLIIMTGNVSGAYVFNPIMAFLVNMITIFIKNVVIPVTAMACAVKIINYMTENAVLTKYADLLKKGCDMALKASAALFLSILTLQKISAPILNNLALKTAKATANAIPVVGGVVSAAVDTVIYWSGAVKSGVMVALIIIIVIACAASIIKVFVMLCIFKVTAAMIQPICDDRIVECLDSVGAFLSTVMNAGIITVVMFIFSVMILLSF